MRQWDQATWDGPSLVTERSQVSSRGAEEQHFPPTSLLQGMARPR